MPLVSSSSTDRMSCFETVEDSDWRNLQQTFTEDSKENQAPHYTSRAPSREESQYREAQDRIWALEWLLITVPEDICIAKDKA